MGLGKFILVDAYETINEPMIQLIAQSFVILMLFPLNHEELPGWFLTNYERALKKKNDREDSKKESTVLLFSHLFAYRQPIVYH